MAVGYRSSSVTASTDDQGTVADVPVPAGAQANDIALVALEMWEAGSNVTVTPPSGFTQFIDISLPAVSGTHKLKVFWKRLAGADSGNYSFSWSGAQWYLGHAMLVTGGKLTGNPIGSNYDTDNATGVSATPATSVTTGFAPFLAHFVANENAATQISPPTGFTVAQNGNVLHTNYCIPGTTGAHTASGGTLATLTHQIVALVAIEPEPDAITTRWQRADGVALQPFLKTGGGLVELE